MGNAIFAAIVPRTGVEERAAEQPADLDALLSAIQNKDIELFDYLLDVRGVDGASVDPRSQRNGLHVALSYFTDELTPEGLLDMNGKCFHFVYRLLEAGANINQKDYRGETPLLVYLRMQRSFGQPVNKPLLYYLTRRGAVSPLGSTGDSASAGFGFERERYFDDFEEVTPFERLRRQNLDRHGGTQVDLLYHQALQAGLGEDRERIRSFIGEREELLEEVGTSGTGGTFL